MKEYLGNYLGLCINNDDPEKRGRVQVFIPHIMPALYENWNEAGEDIKLICVGDNLPDSLPGPVIEKLKKILPWAESALPVMGASAAGSLISSPSYSQEVGENFYDQSPVPDPPITAAGIGTGALGPAGAPLAIPSINSGADFKNLNPVFTQRLNAFYNEAASLGYKVSVTSGYRSIEKQRQLYNASSKNGGVAPPGSSAHNYGIAVDMRVTGNGVNITSFNASSDRSVNRDTPQFRTLLAKYGLHQPLHPQNKPTGISEHWHVEPIETGIAGSGRRGGSIFSSISNSLAGTGGAAALASGRETSSSTATPAAPAPHQNPAPVGTPNEPRYGSIADPKIQGGGSAGGSGAGGSTSSGKYNSWRSQPVLASSRMNARSNNPGNLHTISRPYAGQVSSSADIAPAGKYGPGRVNTGNVAYFDTLENGIAQNINQINLNINKYGTNTISSMARRWVGGSEANVQYAINVWSRSSGISPNETLNINNRDQMKALLAGISVNEGGGIPANYDQAFDNGYNIWQNRVGGTPVDSTAAATAAQSTPTDPIDLATQGGQMVQNPDPHGTTAVMDLNNMAAGLFSYPSAGALLWCFFREGNPLYPVYFAASYGQKEWQSAYRYNVAETAQDGVGYKPAASQSNPVTSKGGTLNLDKAGALHWVYETDPNDPTKNQRSLMITGHDGSNMFFNEGYHQIYSKFDRRDVTEGDSWKTVLGYEEKWVQGDSNTVVMGDMFVKVGNVGPDAVQAVERIQQIIKDCMQPLIEPRNCGEGGGASGGSSTTKPESKFTKEAKQNSSILSDAELNATGYLNPNAGTNQAFDAPISLNLTNSQYNSQPSFGLGGINTPNITPFIASGNTGNTPAAPASPTRTIITPPRNPLPDGITPVGGTLSPSIPANVRPGPPRGRPL